MTSRRDFLRSTMVVAGIPLVPGHIEVVGAGDALAGASNENVGKIKLWAWLGSMAIPDPLTTQAHVG